MRVKLICRESEYEFECAVNRWFAKHTEEYNHSNIQMHYSTCRSECTTIYSVLIVY